MIERTPLENWIRDRLFAGDKYLSREKLDAYQLAALRDTLACAKANSPFYQKHLAGVDTCDIKTMEDIRMLPFMVPEDIRSNGNRMVCVGAGDISRIVTLDTSGTTGAPKRLYFTAEDQELTVDFFHHGMSVFTQSDDRVLILLPGVRPGSVGDLLQKGLSRMQAQGLIYGIVSDFDEAERIILDEDIHVIVGIPQQVFALSCMGRANQIKEKGYLHSVLLSTDYVPNAMAQKIEERWGCNVYEHYGMTETGLGGGVSCKAKMGYHLREADLLFEIIDPDTGRALPDGEYGEVVFTTLTRTGMPLIRYRTRDISRFIQEPCPCGTVLKKMEKIRYRHASSVLLRNGYRLTMPELDECLFQVDGITDFEAEVTILDGAEYLILSVDASSDILNLEMRIRDALVQSGIKELLLRKELKIGIKKAADKTPDIKGIRKRGILDVRAVTPY